MQRERSYLVFCAINVSLRQDSTSLHNHYCNFYFYSFNSVINHLSVIIKLNTKFSELDNLFEMSQKNASGKLHCFLEPLLQSPDSLQIMFEFLTGPMQTGN